VISVALSVAGCSGSDSPKGFTPLYPAASNAPAILSIRGSGPTDVWAAGQNGLIVHYNGSGNPWLNYGAPTSGDVARLTGITPTNAYAYDVTYREMLRWTGGEWQAEGPADSTRHSIWSDGPDGVWGVGDSATHWDGTAWSQVASNVTGTLDTVDGFDASNIWAVVAGDGFAEYGGTSWNAITSNNTTTINGTWVSGPADVWFVGMAGLVLHRKGDVLMPVDVGTQENLLAVTGTGPNDVWVAGGAGTLVHWNGTAWKSATNPSGQDINCAWSQRPNEVLIGDASGWVLQYDP
jgi:hypothetical protein